MALANYSDLKASLLVHSKSEGDPDVVNALDDFIKLTEEYMFLNADDPLRIRSMLTTTTSATSTSDRFQTLPTGYLAPRRYDITISNERIQLQYETPDFMTIRSSAGTPSAYTITNQIEFDATSDVAYTTNFLHYAKLTGLSSSNTTNDVITNHPSIYLYGGLFQIYTYLEDVENIAKYQGLAQAAITGANRTDRNGNLGVASQKRRQRRSP
jgi:hypothetical protein